NSPLDEFARGEGGYGIRFGRPAAVIISPSPTARHPQGDQPPFDPPVRSPGDERDLLSKAAVRAMAADRAHRLRGLGRPRRDPAFGAGAPSAGSRRPRAHRPPGGPRRAS